MSESILIADDSVLVRESIETALRARGARVEVVNDGTQALERLRDAAPDLVIADVHMPGVDGYDVCREAKVLRPGCRVLLLVGTFEPFDSGAASSARADGVVRKPFLADELLRKVAELLGPVRSRTPERVAIEEAPRAPEPLIPDLAAIAAEAAATAETGEGGGSEQLSDADIDRIARRVLELGGAEVLERVARELLGEAAVDRARRSGDLTSPETPSGGLHDWRGDPERE